MSLSAVAPLGATSGVTVQITGTGFAPGAADNDVILTPATGAAVTLPGEAIAPLTGDIRRLAITVPAGLPIGSVAVQVRNRISGEIAGGRTLQIFELTLAPPVAAVRGSTATIRIVGSANTQFVAGRTSLVIGNGVTAALPQVLSATELTSNVTIAATAPLGPRVISITTSTQTGRVAVGLSVVDTPPANRDPIANANGPYSGIVSQSMVFSSAGSSDPDGDPLQYTWDFGDGGKSTDSNPQHTYASAGPFTATLTLSDGRGGSASATAAVTIAPPPNRNPTAQANGPYTGNAGDPIVFSSAGSVDPDNDPLSFAWDFGDGSKTTEPNPQHAYQTAGPFTASLTVDDGRGGTGSATASVNVTTAVTLQSLSVDPPSLHFSQFNVTTALAVTGHYSDGSERNLTDPQTGTTYSSTATGVASAGANGVITSVGDGEASITVSNGPVTRGVPVVVEQGVTLQALELTPPIVTLRAPGITAPTTLRGTFSNGTQRDLTSDPGTTYSIDQATIASVTPAGLLTALAPGDAVLTARYGGLSATAQVHVLVTAGTGFLRGETFDDTRGLPLSGTTATLLVSGGTTIAASATAAADDRGHFVVPAAAGDALVRIARSGFTTVDRQTTLTSNGIATLLDARLTPLDGKVNLLQSVFGGEATSSDGTAGVTVPSGSLSADTALRVTPISNQGLQGLLPIGWSPIAAVDLQPSGRTFTQPATLRLPHTDTLAAGAAVTLAMYDAVAHRWVSVGAGQVSSDRRTITAAISVSGHYAFVVPDDAPAAPPAAVVGEALAGVASVAVPDTAKVTGEVTPRSAPPGDGARAVGTIVLQPPASLSSGAVLRARVSEQFDLLDQSQVQPQPFVQDVILYARPRIGAAASLAARLPITPSLQFSIQQLSLGTVHLDVTIDEPAFNQSIVGATGGSLTDAAGNVLEIPAGALPNDVAVGLLPLSSSQLSTPVPAGFTLLGAAIVDLVGASFAQPAALSVPRPAGLDPATQIVVTQVISDGTGGRRLQIVGLGAVTTTRVQIQLTLGALTFPGVRSGGEFAFLQPAQPLGFVTGLVSGGGSAQALALVTADTAPFAAVTGATGSYIVAGRTGVTTTVSAVEPAGANASGAATLAALNAIATINLSVAVTAPAVVATVPATNATNVALDAPILVDFSKAIDPATITATAVVLRAGPSVVSAQTSLSANRKRLTVTPAAPLSGLTVYTLTLTSDIRDGGGAALATFAPLSFTTLDPSKATALALGIITAELPDEDGLSLVTGAPGAAEPNSAVVATNLRTQATVTVLALADGSFRLRLTAVVGDEIAITLRDPSGRETTIAITQFSSADGSTSIGPSGGTIAGAGGRIGRVLPRALATAGVFHLVETTAAAPALPPPFSAVDRFTLNLDGGSFRRLDSLTLTENQGRFTPSTTFAPPFSATGQLTVPPDFLVSASLRFTAAVSDREGTRRSASGATVVVASAADGVGVETGSADQFPTVYVTAPKQATPGQVIDVSAIAPAARIEFDLPTSFTLPPGQSTVLARLTIVGGENKLAIVDRFESASVSGQTRLRTAGRNLPGTSRAGDYVVVAGPLAFVTGTASGPQSIVSADGSPFIFETDGANGTFALPVPANAPFTLRFTDAATGGALGTASGQAPSAGGATDLGRPLAPAGNALRVTAQPDGQGVDIGAALVFMFSEPIDRARVSANAFVVSDAAGARAFGNITVSADARMVTFVPLRRWKFATRYRYGVATSVVGASGAVLPQTFAGEFTTFMPRVLGALPLAGASDVAVGGSVGLVATPDGAAVLELTRPDVPVVVANIPQTDGSRGVALVPTPLVDRSGQTTPAPIAVVTGGGETTAATVRAYALATPSAPLPLGTTTLTPTASGLPNHVTVSPTGLAHVSIRSSGLQNVALGEAIPDDPANAGRALAARYPASGSADVVQSARIGSRLAVAKPAVLAVVDEETLVELGSSPSAAALTSVAGVQSLPVDLNGDGRIDSPSELIDVAVAGDESGVLQVHRLRADGAPELISAIRMPGASRIEGVTLSIAEGIAYVGLGPRGLALIDLLGPPSIQPIDVDRDGEDDRVLGRLNLPGSVSRVALALDRGVGFIALGAAGVASVQLMPPRLRFETILRDPITAMVGDEQPLLSPHSAFATDDGLQVTVSAIVPPQSDAFVTIDEVPAAGGERLLSFSNGAPSARLVNGSNTVAVAIRRGGTTEAALKLQTSSGGVLARQAISIVPPDDGGASIAELRIVPHLPVIDGESDSIQLAVLGTFSSGLNLNLSTAGSGSVYEVANNAIATIDPDGLARAGAGGHTEIRVTNRGLSATDLLDVRHAPALVGLDAPRSRYTLTAPDAEELLVIDALFSDGTSQPAAAVAGTTFVTSDPAVVQTRPDGVVVARGNGVATVTVSNGPASVDLSVAVELRTPPVVTAIALQPFAAGVTTDEATALARGRLDGTGSLEGLPVTLTVSGPVAVSLTTTSAYGGAIVTSVDGLTSAGTYQVTASVVNPANGQTLSDTKTLVIGPGSADREPNDTLAGASTLAINRQVTGTLDGSSDPVDAFRLEATEAGSFTTVLKLGAGTDFSTVTVVIRDAAGAEVARFRPTSTTNTFALPPASGPLFYSIESTAPVTYTVSSSFEQGPIAITSVSPLGGATGTPVHITGTGFSTVMEKTRVLFAGVVGKVQAVTATSIDVLVPANAVNGAIEVISAARRATGPQFVTGTAGELPPGYVLPGVGPLLRFDPLSRQVLNVRRIVVYFDPTATRAYAEALAQREGATILGANPPLNSYVFEFAANQTVAELERLVTVLEGDAQVRYALPERRIKPNAMRIDIRDTAGRFPPFAGRSRGDFADVAYQQARVVDAIEAVRSNPPFDVSPAPFQPVRVAVIDSGFRPSFPSDFRVSAGGASIVTTLSLDANTGQLAALGDIDPVVCHLVPMQGGGTTTDCDGGHGTAVTSIIAAVNDGANMSGVLSGLLRPGEPPFQFTTYSTGERDGFEIGLNSTAIELALTSVGLRASGSTAFDVVNLSLGANLAGNAATQALYWQLRRAERDLYQLMAGRTLAVTAAGNEGVDARFSLPASLQDELPHVLSIGAVAVADGDGTGETGNERAEFNKPNINEGFPCDPVIPIHGSNCGDAVTLAAPGEDVLMMLPVGYTGAPGYFPQWASRGTSMASPITAGVAAMLQAIRPTATPLLPDRVRRLLVDTATDISAEWNPGNMRMVNALAAVRALLQLPSDQQHIYVADKNAPNGGGRLGQIIAVNMDPATGEPTVDVGDDRAIDLSFFRSAPFFGRSPTTLVTAPTGDKLYVLVTAETPPIGEGVLIISTQTLRAESFVALSGEPVDPALLSTAQIHPAGTSGLKAGMAVSQDGRLLYVASGLDITIINLVSETVVRSLRDLPPPYNALDILQPPNALATRFDQLNTRALLAPPAAVGRFISGLTLSPDGGTLYAVITSGGGTGQQPGAVQAIDVDLYKDALPDSPGLQSDLSTYFTLRGPAMTMANAGQPAGGDEPSAVAINGNGEHLYLVNGGVEGFEGLSPGALDPAKFFLIMGGPIFAALQGGVGGLLGLATSITAFAAISPSLYLELLADLTALREGGTTLLAAPSFTGVFDGSPSSGTFGQQTGLFPTDVVFGWRTNAALGGLIVNQSHFANVFAKRPFGLATSPNGTRAVMPMFQTGNFGFLDTSLQPALTTPNVNGLPPTMFRAVLGVTRAITLDSHLWPNRGALRIGTTFVPSPDERLLYPTSAIFSQNGVFAAAVHTGTPPVQDLTVQLPDFEHDFRGAKLPLEQLGFVLQGSSGIDPDGRAVSVGDTYTFKRGGGAITILNSARMAFDVNGNAGTFITGDNGISRPYFTQEPITDSAVTHLYEYEVGVGIRKPFYEPRGIAIQPFVSIESPRFGDTISPTDAIQISWRDSRIDKYELRLIDLPHPRASTGTIVAVKFDPPLTPLQLQIRSASFSVADLLQGFVPTPGHAYRLEVDVTRSLNGSQLVLSRKAIIVRFNQ